MAEQTMKERVARAMYQSLVDDKRSFSATGLRVNVGQIDLERFARAAIEALRDPTEAVGLAIYAAWDKLGEDAVMGPQEALVIWRAGVDAALK